MASGMMAVAGSYPSHLDEDADVHGSPCRVPWAAVRIDEDDRPATLVALSAL